MNSVQTLYEAAKDKHQRGRATEAERLYREALAVDSDHADALQGLGVLCLQTRRSDAAVKYLQKAAARDGGSATVWNNLGVALCATRRFSEAVEAYRQACAVEPESVSTLVNLARVLNETGDNEEALVHLKKAAALEPERADLLTELGSALIKCGQADGALECFGKALEIEPDSAQALCGLGEALGCLDRHEEAVAVFERSLALAPSVALLHYNLGSALVFLGRLDEAGRVFERAATLAPDVPVYRYAAMAMRKTKAGDPHLAALERMAPNRFSPAERAELSFALAKAFDDLEEYDRAFEHLKSGNQTKRGLVRYDEDKEIGVLRDVAALFTAEFMAARKANGTSSAVPVFVVGMPRSGTSLVEQILASHPDVFGAGEQRLLPDLVNRAWPSFPSEATNVGGEEWRSLGERYAEALSSLAPQANRIVDKLPGNFVYCGLIHLALPNARIVHVRRDPLDTCLSCYSKSFGGAVNYAYDLGELGRYYRAYDRLMAHWRHVLPAEAMLDVQYEQLVGDLKTEVRRLVTWCDLEWDDRCLNFYETKRVVRTASAFQVRQPLYRSAIGRAAHYAHWLTPLLAALEDSGK